MRLPNGDRAIIGQSKLVDYILNIKHRKGMHKARVFRSALGVTAADAHVLRDALAEAARSRDATPTRRNAMGQLYQLDFPMAGPRGQAVVRSGWIVRDGEDSPDSPPRL
jgi:hypothetical protein